jgi:predicted dehydrogenase
MNKIYKIIVIGCGHMGEEHLRDIYFRDNIKIAAVIDRNAKQAQLAARKYGADAWGTDYKPWLDPSKTDIAIIATYTSTHLSILKECLKNGIHVLCEKPIALNMAQATEFYKAVKSSEPKVLVGHILRHNATYQKAAQMIQSGQIGFPIVMRMVQNHHTMDWDRYKKLLADCSPIVDCGVHYFDVMQWFTGERIVKVSGIKSTIDTDTPENSYNYGLVTARLSGGSVGYYEAGWSNNLSSCNLKEFIGPKGRISIILSGNRDKNREEGDLIELFTYPGNEYKQISIKSEYKPTYIQLLNLIGMIEGTEEGRPTIDEVYSAFKAAYAADTALRSDKEVTL